MIVSVIGYVYLDEPGIDSLYAQTVERMEVERRESKQKKLGGKANAKFSLGKLLSLVLQSPDVEAGFDVTGEKSDGTSTTSTFTVEQKLDKLLTHLKKTGEPTFFDDFFRAIDHVRQTQSRVFISCVQKFNAPQFMLLDNGCDLVNESGYLLLRKNSADDYDYSDDYFKTPKFCVSMSCGLAKMKRSNGQMRYLGHDALYIRGHNGVDIPFGVFGMMMPTATVFHIKPLALWL